MLVSPIRWTPETRLACTVRRLTHTDRTVLPGAVA